MKSDCIHHSDQTLIMKFPRYVQLTDEEITFVTDVFSEPIDPALFPDLWHDKIKYQFAHWVYRHYPESDKAVYFKDEIEMKARKDYLTKMFPCVVRKSPGICDCADPYCPHKGYIGGMGRLLLSSGPSGYKYDLNKWNPGAYPILHFHLDYFTNGVDWLNALSPTFVHPVNMLRFTYPMPPVESEIAFRIYRGIGDFLEGLWFESEIPTSVQITCNAWEPVNIVPTGRYLFLGMIPISQCRYSDITFCCTFGGKSTKSPKYFEVKPIMWRVPDLEDLAIENVDITLEFPGHQEPWHFILRNNTGIFIQKNQDKHDLCHVKKDGADDLQSAGDSEVAN